MKSTQEFPKAEKKDKDVKTQQMKILYDKIIGDYKYPLSKKDLQVIKEHITPDVLKKIRVIRFGCNTRTTQEGRLSKYTSVYDIKINFFLKNNESNLLSEDKRYISDIKYFGGKVDLNKKKILWDRRDSKRYAFFLLLHEIAHIKYDIQFNREMRKNTSKDEEAWCNNFAINFLKNRSRFFEALENTTSPTHRCPSP